MFYDLSNDDFAKILRWFAASGSPKAHRVNSIGHMLHCINDDARQTYQLIYMTRDDKAFVVEYIWKFASIQIVTGNIESFNELFGVKAIKSVVA